MDDPFQTDDGAHGAELWGVSPAGDGGSCVAGTETLGFEAGRFSVRVRWLDPRSGPAW